MTKGWFCGKTEKRDKFGNGCGRSTKGPFSFVFRPVLFGRHHYSRTKDPGQKPERGSSEKPFCQAAKTHNRSQRTHGWTIPLPYSWLSLRPPLGSSPIVLQAPGRNRELRHLDSWLRPSATAEISVNRFQAVTPTVAHNRYRH